jgi:hypothetical protein
MMTKEKRRIIKAVSEVDQNKLALFNNGGENKSL